MKDPKQPEDSIHRSNGKSAAPRRLSDQQLFSGNKLDVFRMTMSLRRISDSQLNDCFKGDEEEVSMTSFTSGSSGTSSTAVESARGGTFVLKSPSSCKPSNGHVGTDSAGTCPFKSPTRTSADIVLPDEPSSETSRSHLATPKTTGTMDHASTNRRYSGAGLVPERRNVAVKRKSLDTAPRTPVRSTKEVIVVDCEADDLDAQKRNELALQRKKTLDTMPTHPTRYSSLSVRGRDWESERKMQNTRPRRVDFHKSDSEPALPLRRRNGDLGGALNRLPRKTDIVELSGDNSTSSFLPPSQTSSFTRMADDENQAEGSDEEYSNICFHLPAHRFSNERSVLTTPLDLTTLKSKLRDTPLPYEEGDYQDLPRRASTSTANLASDHRRIAEKGRFVKASLLKIAAGRNTVQQRLSSRPVRHRQPIPTVAADETPLFRNIEKPKDRRYLAARAIQSFWRKRMAISMESPAVASGARALSGRQLQVEATRTATVPGLFHFSVAVGFLCFCLVLLVTRALIDTALILCVCFERVADQHPEAAFTRALREPVLVLRKLSSELETILANELEDSTEEKKATKYDPLATN